MKKTETKKTETKKTETKKPTAGTKGHFGMVVLEHLPQDTERTIIPYLNKEETLEGLLNDEYRTWKNKLTNHPETRGKIEIKIYSCFVTVSYIVFKNK